MNLQQTSQLGWFTPKNFSYSAASTQEKGMVHLVLGSARGTLQKEGKRN